MPRAYRTVTLSMGLIQIDTQLGAIVDDGNGISGSRYCPEHRAQVNQAWWCPEGEHVMKDTILGYVEGDKIVFPEKAQMDAFNATRDGTMQIEYFAPAKQVDPVWFDSTYVLWPKSGARDIDPFRLVGEAMARKNLVAVGKTTLTKTERLAVVRWSPIFKHVFLSTCIFSEQLRWVSIEESREIAESRPKPPKAQMDLALQLVDSMTGDFHPELHEDTRSKAMRDFLATLARGEEYVAESRPSEERPAGDLMDSLRQMVAAKEREKAHD